MSPNPFVLDVRRPGSTMETGDGAVSTEKRNSLLLLALAVLAVLVLAMGLPGVVLSPGQPFSLGTTRPAAPVESGGLAPGSEIPLLIIRGLLALTLALLPVYVVLSLMTPEGRRKLVGYVIALLVLFLAADYLGSLPTQGRIQQPLPAAGAADFDPLLSSGPLPSFPADPPSWLTLVVILALCALAVALGAAAALFIRERRRSKTLFERLGDDARQAIEALQAGGELGQTILVCYREMSRVIREARGITRAAAMTPREFEQGLAEQGFPYESVQTLTRLFEQVRYGHLAMGTDDETRAYACLARIANACDPKGSVDAQAS